MTAQNDSGAVAVPPTVTAPLPVLPKPDAGPGTGAAGGSDAGPGQWRTLVSSQASVARPASVRRILTQVAATVTVAFALVAGIGLLMFQQIAKQEAVHRVAEVTDILAESLVQPALTDAMANDPAAATAGLDEVMRNQILTTQVVRVKLWNPQGLVLYSDERRLIGQRFALDLSLIHI